VSIYLYYPRAAHFVKRAFYSRVLDVLHNPRYAGAYVLGRTRQRKHVDGQRTTRDLPRDQWTVLIHDAHPGYISWANYEENQQRLHDNNRRTRGTGDTPPPREGSALLQWVALCGVCGRRMAVRYHLREGRRVPWYHCARGPVLNPADKCQQIPGQGIDEAVGELLVEAMNPMALEVALSVQAEIEQRVDDADRLRQQQVERARYQADAARRRYLRVDPDNRLVVDALEADWNDKLRTLDAAHEDYERRRKDDRAVLDDEQRERITKLATDFPALWTAASTADKDRKRMLRLLIEDVTLIKGEQAIAIHVRFRGDGTRSLSVARPVQAWKTPLVTVAEIDRLLDEHTDSEIADILNARGVRAGKGGRFAPKTIYNVRRKYALPSRYDRLRARGMLTATELANTVGVTRQTIVRWRREGLIQAHLYNDRSQGLYDPEAPIPQAPPRWMAARKCNADDTQATKGVQYET